MFVVKTLYAPHNVTSHPTASFQFYVRSGLPKVVLTVFKLGFQASVKLQITSTEEDKVSENLTFREVWFTVKYYLIIQKS